LSDRARRSGCRALIGEFQPTPRNAPFAGFYRSAGFVSRAAAEGEELVLALDAPAASPSYIHIRPPASPNTA
jgi:predicted enzyme involved in methoxymalonyl-ACP biosynthesis